MKGFLYIIIFITTFIGCNQPNRQIMIEEPISNHISALSEIYEEMIGQHPNDSIYNSNLWPDTIKVAFTRNGVFEDSVEVYKYGYIKTDSNKFEPTYVFMSAAGDVFRYSYSGSFIKFYKNLQNSDKDYTYEP